MSRRKRLANLARFTKDVGPIELDDEFGRAVNAVAQARSRKMHPDVIHACEQHLNWLRQRGARLPGLPTASLKTQEGAS